MTHTTRPTQITEILKAIDSDYPADIGISLEAYLADLEAKQPERPAQISEILNTIDSDHPLDMGIFLQGYVSDLEARQEAKSPRKGASSRDTEWLYTHAGERKQQHRARALRKQNKYQKP